jgi:hypothetical protein
VDEPKNLDDVDSPENLAGIKVAGRTRRRELFTVQLAGIQLLFFMHPSFLVHGESVVMCAWPVKVWVFFFFFETVKVWVWFDSMRCFLEHRLEFQTLYILFFSPCVGFGSGLIRCGAS